MTTTLESATAILAHVGGAANVAALQHCSARRGGRAALFSPTSF